MKKIIAGLIFIMLISCTSTRLVDRWRNPEANEFKPQKIMILGITQNLTARKIFEEDLKTEFLNRNIDAAESTMVLGDDFTQSMKSEAEIEALNAKLISKGFDALVVTVVKGVDEIHSFQPENHWPQFGRYYYRFQDIYYNPGYYNDYKVYRVETSVYNIRETNGKSLVWVGDFEIVDPQKIRTSVTDYVKAITNRLEQDDIIPKIN